MRHFQLVLLLLVPFVLTEKDSNENTIVRPVRFNLLKASDVPKESKAQKYLEDMEDENLIPAQQGQLESHQRLNPSKDVEITIEESDDSSESQELGGEDIQLETAKAMKRVLLDLVQSFSDYADDGDYDSVEPGSKQRKEQSDDEDEMKKIEDISPAQFIAEQKPVPRLAIDPPRKLVPELSENKDENSKEFKSEDISIPVLVKETNTEKESILVPWNISVSVDISHLLLIILSGFLLFYIVKKAFAQYYRPRSVVISPISVAETGSVHKVPLD